MKASIKSIINQIVSIFLAYFIADWIGGRSIGSAFDIGAGGFVAFFYWPIIYILIIVLVSNLWFQKINKWNYLVPAILVLFLEGLLGYGDGNFWFNISYWFVAFVGGWVLAKIVNFVARSVSK